MYDTILIIMVVCYISIVTTSVITIIYLIKHNKDYGMKIKVLLFVAHIFTTGIIYPTFFLCSLKFYFSNSINILLWKITNVLIFIMLGLSLIIYVFLKEIRKLHIIPLIVYSILLGLLIGTLTSTSSVQIVINPSITAPVIISDLSTINFLYDLLTKTIVLLFFAFIVVYTSYITIIVYIHARNKKTGNISLLILLVFSIPVIFFILYVIFSFQIVRDLHFILITLNIIGIAQFLILKPEMTLSLTNKVYAISIYHKSGILLYSYEFKYESMQTDTEIWGNILI